MFTNSKCCAVYEHARVRYFELGIIQYIYKSKNPGRGLRSFSRNRQSFYQDIDCRRLSRRIHPANAESYRDLTKDIKKYIWKDSIKTYLEEQNEPTEELDMLCNMMQNIKDRYKAFKKSVRFDGQIIEISGKEYADMVMKYALMLPEYNVKKAEKELQDFKDNKINLLTNKEAIVYTGGSLVKNTIKSILHIS